MHGIDVTLIDSKFLRCMLPQISLNLILSLSAVDFLSSCLKNYYAADVIVSRILIKIAAEHSFKKMIQ
jgi:hypothetical protein